MQTTAVTHLMRQTLAAPLLKGLGWVVSELVAVARVLVVVAVESRRHHAPVSSQAMHSEVVEANEDWLSVALPVAQLAAVLAASSSAGHKTSRAHDCAGKRCSSVPTVDANCKPRHLRSPLMRNDCITIPASKVANPHLLKHTEIGTNYVRESTPTSLLLDLVHL